MKVNKFLFFPGLNSVILGTIGGLKFSEPLFYTVMIGIVMVGVGLLTLSLSNTDSSLADEQTKKEQP